MKKLKKYVTLFLTSKAEIGKPKFEYKSFATDPEVYNEIVANFKDRMYQDVQANR